MGTGAVSRAREILRRNEIVRKLSSESMNTEVHWAFFNQVYDVLAEIVDEEMVWWRRHRKLMDWANDIAQRIINEQELDTMLDRLQVLKREMEETQ